MRPVVVAQLTDTHIVADGGSTLLSSQPAMHLEHAVRFLNALTPRPDAVLFTGDLAHTGADVEYARLRTILAELMLPYFVTVGNHDCHEAFRRAFADAPYLQGAGRPVNFAVDVGDLRIVAIDSTVRRPRAAAGVSRHTLAWLDATLNEAPDRPTLMAMHHPPFRSGLVYFDVLGFRRLRQLGELVSRHRNVRLVVAGHVHRPIVAAWRGVTARTSLSTAPQTVPLLFHRSLLSLEHHPPGFTLHRFDDAGVESTTYVGDGRGAFSAE